MKYQLQVIKRIIKTTGWKYLLLFAISSMLLLFIYYIVPEKDAEGIVVSLLGVPNVHMSFLDILWLLLQIFIFLYIAYQFYKYESDNSREFILCRTSKIRFYINKIVFFSFCVIVFRLIYFFCIYLIYRLDCEFNIGWLLSSLLFYTIITIFPVFGKRRF